MKKIMFHYSIFNRGGAEKSTLRLMKLFVKEGWDVSLVLNFRGGTMEEDIPSDIHVRYLSFFTLNHYRNKYLSPFLRILDCLKMLMLIPYYWKRYDIACVGLQGLNPFFVCDIVRAKKSMIFMRNDISLCNNKDGIIRNLNKYSKKLNTLICVSNTVRESVHKEIPQLHDKAKVVYNVICQEEMLNKLEMSANPFKESEHIKVVSVCRMVDHAKGLFRMLAAYDELYSQGIVFEWYFVGDGADLPKMKECIKGKPYEKLIHFEGEKENPFAYYKYADLVAVLSYYEGLCGVINEAKTSGAAVIATEFSGVHEQIVHGENGWIVKNDLDSIIMGLSTIIQDAELLRRLKNNYLPIEISDDSKKVQQIVGD